MDVPSQFSQLGCDAGQQDFGFFNADVVVV